MRALDEHPEAGSAGAKLVDFHRRDVLDGAGDTPALDRHWRRAADTASPTTAATRNLRPSSVRAAARRCTAGALGRRRPVRREFFAFSEDVDWALRAQLAGWTCRYVPSAVVYHMGSATIGRGLSDFTAYHLWRNAIWMIVKNYPAEALVRRAPALAFGFGLNMAAAWWEGKLDVWGRAMRDALRGLPGALKRRRAVQRAAPLAGRAGRRDLAGLSARRRPSAARRQRFAHRAASLVRRRFGLVRPCAGRRAPPGRAGKPSLMTQSTSGLAATGQANAAAARAPARPA